MEEKILEILRGNSRIEDSTTNKGQAAKEIASHIKKNYYEKDFVEWLEYEEDDFVCEFRNQYIQLSTGDNYTREEIYQHWLDNVKK